MLLSSFDFHLPEHLVALRPVEPRDQARMLVVQPDASPELSDGSVRDLVSFLNKDDVLVMNDTKVIPARLVGRRDRILPQDGISSITIELMLHKREKADVWQAFARPAKRLKAGDVIYFETDTNLFAHVISKNDEGFVLLRFSVSGPELDQAIMTIGELPLPPYIAGKRPVDNQDSQDYQTIYAAHEGAVAAPTAGLHFTPELFAALDAKSIQRHFVTLHVGAGTFLPVKTDNVQDHVMHAEWGSVSSEVAQALNTARQKNGRIIAVGTTSLRLLESATDDQGVIHPFHGDTSIFITPGYRFKMVDILLTNFHLPKSTLFMLVSAFSGQDVMRQAYQHAIEHHYRFYSYGDASLLFKKQK